MNIKHLIITCLISISLMIGDFKFNILSYLKFTVNFVIIPLNLLTDLPKNIYDYTKNKKIIENNDKELLLLKVKSQQLNSLILENQKLVNLIGNNKVLNNDNYLITRITNINKSRLRKNITINQGSNSDIKINDIVIGEKGLIGKIIDLNNFYSTVRLITDPLQYTPAINNRSGESAVIRGMAVGENKLIINFARVDADIKLGDVFSTSGSGMLFNSGYNIGKVIDIIQESQNFLTIILKPIQEVEKTIFAIVEKKYNVW